MQELTINKFVNLTDVSSPQLQILKCSKGGNDAHAKHVAEVKPKTELTYETEIITIMY